MQIRQSRRFADVMYAVLLLPLLTWLSAATVVTVLGAQQPRPTTPAGAPMALVIDGVTVIDVRDGHRLPNQRVVIVGNRIRTMGAAGTVPIPAGAQVVDAHGKYLIPGLWDMHLHVFGDTTGSGQLLIANGVTGIRNPGTSVPLAVMRGWHEGILAGERVGPPRQFLAGPAVDEETPCTREPNEMHICVADSADARHVVDSLKAAGADFIKTYALQRDLYFVIAAEARRVGIAFGGHLYPYVATAIQASDSGAGILDHETMAGDLWDRCLEPRPHRPHPPSLVGCRAIAEHFRKNNTWWVPTLIIKEVDPAGNEMRKLSHAPPLSPATQTIIARVLHVQSVFQHGDTVPALWLRGVLGGPTTVPGSPSGVPGRPPRFLHFVEQVKLPVLAGTDASLGEGWELLPGIALHAELAIYVAEGMTPLEALQTATLNPARYLRATDSLGTVAPGKLADLVLLDADPLVDITNTTAIHAVVANGRYFDRTALDHLLTAVQALIRN